VGQLNPHLLGQQILEEIIQTEMKKYNSAIELGVELVSLEQFDDRVEVKIQKQNTENSGFEEELSTYKWVIGADGARGVVRKSLGLTFLGETKVEKFVVGDIKVEGLSDVGFSLFSSSISTIYLKVFRNGICGETWERLCECFKVCQRLAIVLKEYSRKERRFGVQRHQGCSTSLLEAQTWKVFIILQRARMQSERF
jgi:FAD binding domain